MHVSRQSAESWHGVSFAASLTRCRDPLSLSAHCWWRFGDVRSRVKSARLRAQLLVNCWWLLGNAAGTRSDLRGRRCEDAGVQPAPLRARLWLFVESYRSLG